MLERSAEQGTDITMEHVELEVTPTTNLERCMPNLDSVLQQMRTALVALTSCGANDTVANLQKNP